MCFARGRPKEARQSKEKTVERRIRKPLQQKVCKVFERIRSSHKVQRSLSSKRLNRSLIKKQTIVQNNNKTNLLLI